MVKYDQDAWYTPDQGGATNKDCSSGNKCIAGPKDGHVCLKCGHVVEEEHRRAPDQ